MRLFGLIVLSLFSIYAHADVQDTLNLADVWVKDSKYYTLKNSTKLDSAFLKQMQRLNLQQLLQENSVIQFKTYGASGSSLMSIRGANAAHSKVVWNGLHLGSPMLNMNDVSILPIQAADQIELVKGGNTAEMGSGALAGYVSMSSNAKFNTEQIAFNTSYNSLQNQLMSFSYLKSNSKFSSNTSIFYVNQLNKYNYKNYAEFQEPTQSQVNSDVKQWAVIQSMHYKYKKNLFEAHLWYQENDRNLSPPIYNRNKTSYQLDQSFRSILKHEIKLNDKHKIENSIAYTKEAIRFVSRISLAQQDFVLFNTYSYFDLVQAASKWSYVHHKFKQSLSFNYVYEGANVEDYERYKSRNRFSISSNSNYHFNNRINIEFNNRLEKISTNNENLFASSLQLNYQMPFVESMFVYGRLSKNYNLPGLNDLYWSPGGNPNLKSENSFERELGLIYTHIRRNTKNHLQISYYRSLVEDWILWQPSAAENGFWSPQNLKEVVLEGIEFENEMSYRKNKFHLRFKLFYTYNLAINKKASHINDLSVNKQLIYVPKEKYGVNLRLQYFNTSLMMKQYYVSHRFTTTDNTMFLASYHIVDVQLEQEFQFKDHTLRTQLFIDNIFNISYESIPYQIMPARVFGIGLNYLLNKK